MTQIAPIFDVSEQALFWTQDGTFRGADGVAVRAYDDVVLLRDIKPENDPSAADVVPAGTTGTVLFFSTRSDGVAQLELSWRPRQVVIGYEDQRFLRLHMTNEQKYAR